MIDVFETRDAALLRGPLEGDRIGGAYLLGDLEAPFFDQGRWLVAARNGALTAIVLVFEAFADPVVLSFGEVEGVEAILRRWTSSGSFPSQGCLKIPPEHEAAFSRAFEVVEREVMKVMALTHGTARALPDRSGNDVRRLDADFPIDDVLDVYRSYPGHFFHPTQLTTGIYFGSFEGDRLVAVAGTHVYSPAGRVAAVGNIVTALDARGRGHATACTAAVIDALHERGCDTVVLHVAASNAPALACYRRLGFEEHGPVLQLRAARR